MYQKVVEIWKLCLWTVGIIGGILFVFYVATLGREYLDETKKVNARKEKAETARKEGDKLWEKHSKMSTAEKVREMNRKARGLK
jgi:hypothetical protein